DSSKIVMFYSRDYGRISLIARGARRTKSKLSSGLDLFNYSEVVFYKREERELYTVSEAETIESNQSIKNDLDKFNALCCLSELINTLTPREQENEYIFSLLYHAFEYVEESQVFDPLLFTIVFGFKLAVLLGYKPEFNHCVVCKNKQPRPGLYFSAEKGGIVCSDCIHEFKEKVSIEGELLQKISRVFSMPFDGINDLGLSKVGKKKLAFLINRLFIENAEIERNLCARYWA
ncbi:DNA repair protein RecO, partial [bacterium]|nr:DNA repair protein RecO [bacterium]